MFWRHNSKVGLVLLYNVCKMVCCFAFGPIWYFCKLAGCSSPQGLRIPGCVECTRQESRPGGVCGGEHMSQTQGEYLSQHLIWTRLKVDKFIGPRLSYWHGDTLGIILNHKKMENVIKQKTKNKLLLFVCIHIFKYSSVMLLMP